MLRLLHLLIIFCLGVTLHTGAFAQAPDPTQKPAPRIEAKDILPYLEQVIAWQQQVANIANLPENARQVFLKDALTERSLKIVKNAFDFARAEAAMMKNEPEAKNENVSEDAARRARLIKASDNADKQVAALNQQLGQIAEKLQHAPKRQQASLSAERERIVGQLKLARAQQALIDTMMGIFNSTGDKEGLTLAERINRLAHTTLEDQDDLSITPATADADENAPKKKFDFPQESDGMFDQITQLFNLTHRKESVDDLLSETETLRTRNRELVGALRVQLREAIEQGNALSQKQNTSDAKSLELYHQSLDALLAQYKQLAGTLVPLGQMSVSLNMAERYLKDWSTLLNDSWNSLLKRLSLRLAVLAIAILIPWIFSKLAERTISRYVQDTRRRRQLQILRRVILGCVLALVILVNFVTEFGSLATFAGFITAGLAVALQTVLVSLVAHFFFFGRFGVRAGDRITVAGVTGDVVQVGMLRLYVRQLDEKDPDLKPTGKIVAFPNSILFQPSAFYKHMDE